MFPTFPSYHFLLLMLSHQQTFFCSCAPLTIFHCSPKTLLSSRPNRGGFRYETRKMQESVRRIYETIGGGPRWHSIDGVGAIEEVKTYPITTTTSPPKIALFRSRHWRVSSFCFSPTEQIQKDDHRRSRINGHRTRHNLF